MRILFLWLVAAVVLFISCCHQFEFHHHLDFDWGQYPTATPTPIPENSNPDVVRPLPD